METKISIDRERQFRNLFTKQEIIIATHAVETKFRRFQEADELTDWTNEEIITALNEITQQLPAELSDEDSAAMCAVEKLQLLEEMKFQNNTEPNTATWVELYRRILNRFFTSRQLSVAAEMVNLYGKAERDDYYAETLHLVIPDIIIDAMRKAMPLSTHHLRGEMSTIITKLTLTV